MIPHREKKAPALGPHVVEAIEREIRAWAAQGTVFSVEHVRRSIGARLESCVDTPQGRMALGRFFRDAAWRGDIEPVGYTAAARPEARGRVLRTWRGKA